MYFLVDGANLAYFQASKKCVFGEKIREAICRVTFQASHGTAKLPKVLYKQEIGHETRPFS